MALVYIASPYSGGNTNRNVLEAMRVGMLILDTGHVPFVPHLCHFWDVSFPRGQLEAQHQPDARMGWG